MTPRAIKFIIISIIVFKVQILHILIISVNKTMNSCIKAVINGGLLSLNSVSWLLMYLSRSMLYLTSASN